MHYLKRALIDGLKLLDTDELLDSIAKHVTAKGEWETGVISPSLVATECRLARLKKFLGDDPQPGVKRLAVRAGEPDAVTQLNFLRGFCMEGAIVASLIAVLGQDRIVGHAPELLFRWRYKGDDALLNMWTDGKGSAAGMVFAGHPDLLVQSPDGDLELVQIKSPSIYKFERVNRLGDEDALKNYRAQIATEMYIGCRIGYPIKRSHLLMATWEGTPKITEPHCRIATIEWDESLASIPEHVAREVIKDYDDAYTMGRWPEAYPEHKWDSYPCAYCSWSRLGTFSVIGCEEQSEWQRFAETGETRLTVEPASEDNPKVVPIRKKRTRSA